MSHKIPSDTVSDIIKIFTISSVGDPDPDPTPVPTSFFIDFILDKNLRNDWIAGTFPVEFLILNVTITVSLIQMCAITRVVHLYCFWQKAGHGRWVFMGQRRAGFYSSKHLGLHVKRRFEQKIPPPRQYFVTNTCFFRLKYDHAMSCYLSAYILPSLPVSSFSN